MTWNQAVVNLRWLIQNARVNEAWAVNHCSGFTAQLSEGWASPLLTQQSRKKHSCLFISSLFLCPPPPPPSSPSPLPLFCDEWKVWILRGLPGFLSEARGSWTNNLAKHSLDLKAQSGIYLNYVKFWIYLCSGLRHSSCTWKVDFWSNIITQNLLSATVNKPLQPQNTTCVSSYALIHHKLA